jgi:hypothetical protein
MSHLSSLTGGDELPKRDNLPNIIDSLRRLERVGEESSATTQKLLAAAEQVSQRIAAQYGFSPGEQISLRFIWQTRIPSSNPMWYPDEEACVKPGDWVVWRDRQLRKVEHETEISIDALSVYVIKPDGIYLSSNGHHHLVSSRREFALVFSRDIAGGLLTAIVQGGTLQTRLTETEEGLATLTDVLNLESEQ